MYQRGMVHPINTPDRWEIYGKERSRGAQPLPRCSQQTEKHAKSSLRPAPDGSKKLQAAFPLQRLIFQRLRVLAEVVGLLRSLFLDVGAVDLVGE